jgi:hypothetical protein
VGQTRKSFQYTAVKQELDRARNAGGMVLLSGGYGPIIRPDVNDKTFFEGANNPQECAVSRYVALLSTATHYVADKASC